VSSLSSRFQSVRLPHGLWSDSGWWESDRSFSGYKCIERSRIEAFDKRSFATSLHVTDRIVLQCLCHLIQLGRVFQRGSWNLIDGLGQTTPDLRHSALECFGGQRLCTFSRCLYLVAFVFFVLGIIRPRNRPRNLPAMVLGPDHSTSADDSQS